MLELSILMMERVGIVVLLGFILVSIPQMRRWLFNPTMAGKFWLIVLFSFVAVIANMTAVVIGPHNEIESSIVMMNLPHGDSLANARVLAISSAGIVGGPFVGGMVGLIAGLHRMMQGGPSGWFYVISSLIIGLASGGMYRSRNHEEQGGDPFAILTTHQAFIVGLVMETLQMVFVLLFSERGWELVSFIAFPMIVINTLGTMVFISVISMYLKQENQTRALQTQTVLNLASSTLPYFRQGLNYDSAQKVAQIILDNTNFAAISLTTTKSILAHVGAGSDHHVATHQMVTNLSREAITTNQVHIAQSKEEIGCSNPNCPLRAAIVVPLNVDQKIVGTLKMYYTESWRLTPVEIELAKGLADLFSSQIALGEAEHQANLVRDAEIKSLQAQVNPHFFFNAINTIAAMIRTNSEQARELLIKLSQYFRSNLVGARATTITLDQELAQVEAYLSLEQARFPGKYQVKFDVTANRSLLLPPFAIQILVENAIRYAFKDRRQDNQVTVTAHADQQWLSIAVADNGEGIDPNTLEIYGDQEVESQHGSGTAVYNLNQRLIGLYNDQSRLQIQSSSDGTIVKMKIPVQMGG